MLPREGLVADRNNCEKLVADSPMRLKKTKVLLKMYDGSIMKPLGSTHLLCKFGSVKQKIQFHVVPGKRTLLLSAETSGALGLVTLNAPQEVLSVSKTTCECQPLTKKNIMAQYGYVFHGLGCLPGEYHLEVNPNVIPVKHAPRRVAIPL